MTCINIISVLVIPIVLFAPGFYLFALLYDNLNAISCINILFHLAHAKHNFSNIFALLEAAKCIFLQIYAHRYCQRYPHDSVLLLLFLRRDFLLREIFPWRNNSHACFLLNINSFEFGPEEKNRYRYLYKSSLLCTIILEGIKVL